MALFKLLDEAERRKLVNVHKRMGRIYEWQLHLSRYDNTADRDQEVPLNRDGLQPGKPLKRTPRVTRDGRWNA